MCARFDAGSGATLWTGSLGAAITATPSVAGNKVFVPAGSVIDVFPASGCGSSSCSPAFALERKAGDPNDSFLATPALEGSNVFATNGNGSLYAWPQSGCGAASCRPAQSVVLNAPSGGSTSYEQTPAVLGGMLFVAAQRVVTASDHVLAFALDESTLQTLASWDLGAGTYGAGLGSPSAAWGVVYVPTGAGLIALHAPPVQPLASLTVAPLALTPNFSASTFDYALACAAGTNTVTLTMAAAPGGTVQLVAPITTSPSAAQSPTVQLNENQAAVVRAANAQGATADYWVRCLPHDFPRISVGHPNPGGPTPGWYVLGDNFLPTGAGSFAMILDTNGTPVWYRRATTGITSHVVPLGHDTIAIMQGPAESFTTDPNGHYDVYNLDSNTTSSISAAGIVTDEHELATMRNGDHLLLSYVLKDGVDLTGLTGTPTPGPNSTIADCVVSDVDPQGNLVWRWTGSDHIDPRTETTIAPVPTFAVNGKTVYDVFHCNSIDPNPNGNVLVSARHMNAVFEIRRSDGKILWKMGGTPTNKDGATIISVQGDPDGSFVMQHDARYLPNGDISLFDNENQQTNFAARGVEYSVNFTTHVAHPVFSFAAPTNGPSCCMGDFRRMSDGHSVIGWGLLVPFGGPLSAELDGAGNDVFDLSFPDGGASYRVVKVPPTRFDINVLRATAGQ